LHPCQHRRQRRRQRPPLGSAPVPSSQK
jgi:hypothetical protein